MSLDVKSYPRFDGRHYKKWVDLMIPLLGIVDLKDLLEGTLVAPSPAVTKPAMLTGTPDTLAWSMYNAQLSEFKEYQKELKEFNKRTNEALGVLSQSLVFGIWDRRLKWVSGRVPDGYEAVGMAKPG